MKIRKTFHINEEAMVILNDIYMYHMQQNNKQTYSNLLTEAIITLRDKIIREKEAKESK